MDWMYKKQFDTVYECANYWHNKSCDLNTSSEILWNAWKNGDLIDSGDTYLMLMGLSFELLFKAFYIANGKTPPTHHHFDNLTNECSTTLTRKDNSILKILSGYIIWEGRYPAPKDKINNATNENTGFLKIKEQRKPFVNSLSITDQLSGKSNSKLNRNDLDYDSLLKLWKKINTEYIRKHLKT
ncbi:HEPN domain-containing protein [Desulfocicer niacini]